METSPSKEKTIRVTKTGHKVEENYLRQLLEEEERHNQKVLKEIKERKKEALGMLGLGESV